MGKTASVSPFAPTTLPHLPPLEGVRFATAEAGIRYKGRTDLLVAVLDEGTAAAGVLTQSKTASAPVLWCRKSLKKGKARILVVNSGNANAFTGLNFGISTSVQQSWEIRMLVLHTHQHHHIRAGELGNETRFHRNPMRVLNASRQTFHVHQVSTDLPRQVRKIRNAGHHLDLSCCVRRELAQDKYTENHQHP